MLGLPAYHVYFPSRPHPRLYSASLVSLLWTWELPDLSFLQLQLQTLLTNAVMLSIIGGRWEFSMLSKLRSSQLKSCSSSNQETTKQREVPTVTWFPLVCLTQALCPLRPRQNPLWITVLYFSISTAVSCPNIVLLCWDLWITMLCGISFSCGHILYVFIDVWCLDIAGMKQFPEPRNRTKYHLRNTS